MGQEARCQPGDGRIPADFLLDPIVVAALAVLLLNDHILKGELGNWWTGKLSDFAGMVFFPVLVVAVLEVARWSIRRSEWAVRPPMFWLVALFTAVAFLLIKTVPAMTTAAQVVNQAAATPLRMLGLVDTVSIRSDPSDLVAVPLVLTSVWIGYRWRLDP